jgi:hypothetical protein
MKVEITFKKPDNFLAAAIRGLVSQIEGWQRVAGQTNIMMQLTDSLEFAFKDESQARRFEKAVRKYIAAEFQNDITIKLISN